MELEECLLLFGAESFASLFMKCINKNLCARLA
jgi:hypothetical protein